MTHKHHGINKKIYSLPALFLLLVGLSLLTMNCADDPTSLGLKFLPSNETTGVRIFDSYTDTMLITSRNIKYRVNTAISTSLIVGQTPNYNSKALIRFTSLPDDKDSSIVNSAVLKLKYRNYYFPTSSQDSLAQISFDIYKINQDLNFSTLTMDSVSSSTFGTTSQGNYTGTPTADSQEVDISLSTQLVKDWLEYAANSSYPVPNYGIVLSPNASSAVLKAFYSSKAGADVNPEITVIYTKYGNTDTLIHDLSETLFLTDANISPVPGSFIMQAGISYNQIMMFDMSHVPSNVTINDAQLSLTLDAANSKLTGQTINGIAAAYITDTAGVKHDLFSFTATPTNNVYTFRIIAPFTRWLRGETNYGIFIVPSAQYSNLDLFAFYNVDAADQNKRPRVIIKYTPRVTP
jgi:hypothetical protein